MKITEDTLLAQVLDADQAGGVAEIFRTLGMHCLGCPSSRAETLGEACAVHHADVQELIRLLQAYFEKQQ